MAAEAKDGEKADIRGDPRVVWMCDRLQKAFTQIKADKFAKLFGDADNLCVLLLPAGARARPTAPSGGRRAGRTLPARNRVAARVARPVAAAIVCAAGGGALCGGGSGGGRRGRNTARPRVIARGGARPREPSSVGPCRPHTHLSIRWALRLPWWAAGRLCAPVARRAAGARLAAA